MFSRTTCRTNQPIFGRWFCASLISCNLQFSEKLSWKVIFKRPAYMGLWVEPIIVVRVNRGNRTSDGRNACCLQLRCTWKKNNMTLTTMHAAHCDSWCVDSEWYLRAYADNQACIETACVPDSAYAVANYFLPLWFSDQTKRMSSCVNLNLRSTGMQLCTTLSWRIPFASMWYSQSIERDKVFVCACG